MSNYAPRSHRAYEVLDKESLHKEAMDYTSGTIPRPAFLCCEGNEAVRIDDLD